jgi:hypothetical protein
MPDEPTTRLTRHRQQIEVLLTHDNGDGSETTVTAYVRDAKTFAASR